MGGFVPEQSGKSIINTQLLHLLGCYTTTYVLCIKGADGAPLLNSIVIEKDECRGDAKVETVTQFETHRVMNVYTDYLQFSSQFCF